MSACPENKKASIMDISNYINIIMKHIKIVVEKHPEGYVAYPLGIQGVVVGEGDSYEEALNDVRSAILFHIETFGRSVLESESSVLEAFVAEASV